MWRMLQLKRCLLKTYCINFKLSTFANVTNGSEPHLYCGSTPISEEVCWILTRPHDAPDLISLIQGCLDNLATQGSGATNDKDGVFGDSGIALGASIQVCGVWHCCCTDN